jgi:hypothetical protein
MAARAAAPKVVLDGWSAIREQTDRSTPVTAASPTYRSFRISARANRWASAVVGVALVGAVGAAIVRPAFDAPSDVRQAGAGSVAAPGEFRLGPGNLTPPGVVNPAAGSVAAPGEFRLGPGNLTPPGVVDPAA